MPIQKFPNTQQIETDPLAVKLADVEAIISTSTTKVPNSALLKTTKEALESSIASKAPQATTYTKDEVDSVIAGAGSSLPSFTAYENLVPNDLVAGYNDSGTFKIRKLITDATFTPNTNVTWGQFSQARSKGETGDFVVFNGASPYGFRAYSTASNGTITQGTATTITPTLGSAQIIDFMWLSDRAVFVVVYKFNTSDVRIRTFSLSGTTITLNTEYTFHTTTDVTRIRLCYNPSNSTLYACLGKSDGYLYVLPATINGDNTVTLGTITALVSANMGTNFACDWDSVANAVIYSAHYSAQIQCGFATYTGLTFGKTTNNVIKPYTANLGWVRSAVKYLGGGVSMILSANNTSNTQNGVIHLVKFVNRTTYYARMEIVSEHNFPYMASNDFYSVDFNSVNQLLTIHAEATGNGVTYIYKVLGSQLELKRTVVHSQYTADTAMSYSYVIQDKSHASRLIYCYSSSVMALNISNIWELLGVSQETKTAGDLCKVATIGNKSTIHSALTPNVRYFADNGVISTNPTIASIGRAISTTEIMVGS
jgi:hypothetical protein